METFQPGILTKITRAIPIKIPVEMCRITRIPMTRLNVSFKRRCIFRQRKVSEFGIWMNWCQHLKWWHANAPWEPSMGIISSIQPSIKIILSIDFHPINHWINWLKIYTVLFHQLNQFYRVEGPYTTTVLWEGWRFIQQYYSVGTLKIHTIIQFCGKLW